MRSTMYLKGTTTFALAAVLVILAPAVASELAVASGELLRQWTEFCVKYEREYCFSNGNNDETEKRFGIFKENYDFIVKHNMGSSNFTMGINQFADMTDEEFESTMLSKKPLNELPNSAVNLRRTSTKGPATRHYHSNETLPDYVDWRAKGAVTEVKNQLNCGSCYAFSATGAIEGAVFVNSGKLTSLSEQEIVDCDGHDGGCNGGYMENVFQFAIDSKGLCSEEDYSYEGHRHFLCHTKPFLWWRKGCQSQSQISSYVEVAAKDEMELQKAVAQQPVSVSIHAGDKKMRFYKSGVYNEPCATDLNHGVLAVGYGTTADAQDYWLIKNSWSDLWGDEGYIKFARNIPEASGQCGIALDSSYPVV